MDDRTSIQSDIVLDGLIRGKYPDLLREMAFVVLKCIRFYGIVPTMTSSFREGDKGVHGFYRGLDFRTWELTMSQIKLILKYVNQRYCYDPKRPTMNVLLYHDTGRGPHLHLQSHPNSYKLKGDANDGKLSGGGMQRSEGSQGEST